MRRISSSSDRIRQYLNEKNMRPVELCDMILKKADDFGEKFSKSHLSLYMNGKVEPSQRKLIIMADAMGVNPSWLMGLDVPEYKTDSNIIEKTIQLTTIPLIGKIACGKPIDAVENIEGTVQIPYGTNADFALQCQGDSMSPQLNDEDYVFIRSQPDVEEGQTAAVIIDGEATLKRVYHRQDGLFLVANNPDYAPILVVKTDVRIIGLAIGVYHNIINSAIK